MKLEMFVNEISFNSPAPDVPGGQKCAKEFVMTIKAATDRGVGRVLRTPEDFLRKPIAPGYDWFTWLQDNRVEREVRQYFRSLVTRSPFLWDEPNAESEWAEIDCFWHSQKTFGLKAAYVADGLALSMPFRSDWDTISVQCEIQEIVGDDVTSWNEVIHHASQSSHLGQQKDWIHRRIKKTISEGKELWKCVGEYFPSLLFCPVIEDQMSSLPKHSLASIMRGLSQLNDYCIDWKSGAFNPSAIECNVSPESPSTLQKFSKEREALCPDKKIRTFSWHVKVGLWRIYFDPIPGPGKLFVGYVGDHLRTVKFQ
jgi:hypothetical protein